MVGPATLVHGPIGRAESTLRLAIGLVWVFLCSAAFTVALFFLLPSRSLRIKVGNVYGSFIGKGCAWLTGSRYTIVGREHANPARPAIYVANHASLVDIFLGAWLSPTGTCGVAKKEIVFYPFFGQFFWLAGHLRIDRGNHERAVASLTALVELVRRHALSIFIWPEGHRSRDGRLRPFKKGAFHVALSTGLPIVPMVIGGSHHAWEARSLRLARAEVQVTFLPPIDTRGWRRETLDQHIAEVERVMAAALPPEQRPAVEPSSAVPRAA